MQSVTIGFIPTKQEQIQAAFIKVVKDGDPTNLIQEVGPIDLDLSQKAANTGRRLSIIPITDRATSDDIRDALRLLEALEFLDPSDIKVLKRPTPGRRQVDTVILGSEARVHIMQDSQGGPVIIVAVELPLKS